MATKVLRPSTTMYLHGLLDQRYQAIAGRPPQERIEETSLIQNAAYDFGFTGLLNRIEAVEQMSRQHEPLNIERSPDNEVH